MTARIARNDGVSAYEGTRVFGATVPSCGAGLTLARAGKALAARRFSCTPDGALVGALVGAPAWASALGNHIPNAAAEKIEKIGHFMVNSCCTCLSVLPR